MPDITASITVPSETTVTTPIVVTAAGGGDFFQADQGAVYQVRAANGHSSPQNIVADDPTTPAIPGATVAANPDLTFVIPNAAQRLFRLNANRLRDPVTGRINLSYSGVTLLTYEIEKIRG